MNINGTEIRSVKPGFYCLGDIKEASPSYAKKINPTTWLKYKGVAAMVRSMTKTEEDEPVIYGVQRYGGVQGNAKICIEFASHLSAEYGRQIARVMSPAEQSQPKQEQQQLCIEDSEPANGNSSPFLVAAAEALENANAVDQLLQGADEQSVAAVFVATINRMMGEEVMTYGKR